MREQLVTLDILDRYALLRESLRLDVEILQRLEAATDFAAPDGRHMDDSHKADFICWMRENLLDTVLEDNMTDEDDGYLLVGLLINDGIVTVDQSGEVRVAEDRL